MEAVAAIVPFLRGTQADERESENEKRKKQIRDAFISKENLYFQNERMSIVK